MTMPAIAELVGGVYEACLDPDTWPGFAESLRQYFDSPMAGVQVRHVNGEVGQSAIVGLTPQTVRTYADRFSHRDPLFDRAVRAKRGIGHSFRDLDAQPSLVETAFYEDFVRRIGLRHTLFGLTSPAFGYSISLSVMRTDQRPFTAEKVEHFSELIRYLERGLQASAKSSVSTRFTPIGFDQLSYPVIVLGHDRRILSKNAAAETLLGSCDLLGVRGDRVVALATRDHDALEEAIGAALAADKLGPVKAAHLSGGRARRPLVLLSVALSQGTAGEALWSTPAVALFFADPSQRFFPNEDHVRQLYGLTRQEGRIAEAVAEGSGLSAVARKLGVTRETVRFHLTNVYGKMGVHSQAELTYTLLSDPGVLFAARNGAATAGAEAEDVERRRTARGTGPAKRTAPARNGGMTPSEVS